MAVEGMEELTALLERLEAEAAAEAAALGFQLPDDASLGAWSFSPPASPPSTPRSPRLVGSTEVEVDQLVLVSSSW